MTLDFFDRLKYLKEHEIPRSNVNAIIIKGAGRHFSSGADLEDLFTNIISHIKYHQDGTIKQYPEFLKDNIESFLFS